ncbi:hypothetical protein [Pseudophaeobacter arcticus]|uniref:hypothetical protein n=1 Tax=Pseudophaeobacter arcticus TaxID=385492 RepID=UPI0036D3D773
MKTGDLRAAGPKATGDALCRSPVHLVTIADADLGNIQNQRGAARLLQAFLQRALSGAIGQGDLAAMQWKTPLRKRAKAGLGTALQKQIYRFAQMPPQKRKANRLNPPET